MSWIGKYRTHFLYMCTSITEALWALLTLPIAPCLYDNTGWAKRTRLAKLVWGCSSMARLLFLRPLQGHLEDVHNGL